ncbi:MAG: ribosome maturation factor RimP [Lactobacillales bacterium]|jgi:ribosome maturation factor RimP|nr:ribosome maturation factor RimP [Lactobacillales bacterium]
MSALTDKVTAIAEPIAQELNLELVDVEYVKEGSDYFLRVMLDKEGGIDLDTCALANEKISEVLDENENLIKEVYFLDVCSPGVERPLKTQADFEKAFEEKKYINVSLYQAIDKVKMFEGDLIGLDDETITLEYLDKTRVKKIEIPRKNIAKARLAIKF